MLVTNAEHNIKHKCAVGENVKLEEREAACPKINKIPGLSTP
jgi:hypothetical protein